MQVWKPLLAILPAGLVLGMIGGHYARPVVQQRPGEDAVSKLFGDRSAGANTAAIAPDPSYPAYDVAGPDSVPAFADDDREITGWQGPDFKNWPAYTPAPMPTIAQLQAETAARDAALDRHAYGQSTSSRDGESAADAAENAADDAASRFESPDTSGKPRPQDFPSPSPGPQTAEPRTADGKLPAIW